MSLRAFLAAMVVAALPRPAMAQDEGFDAHGFTLVAQDGDVRDPLAVMRPGRFHLGEFWASGFFEYASAPLVLVYEYDDGRPDEHEIWLDDVVASNFSLGGAVHDRVRLDLAFPLFFASTTQRTPAGGDPTPGNPISAQGFAMGDMRLTAMAAIVRPSDGRAGGLGLGFAPYLDLPTGNDAKLLGKPGVAFGARVAATYEIGGLTVSGDVGPQLNPAVSVLNFQGADQLHAGFAVGYAFSRGLGLGGEAHWQLPLQSNAVKGTETIGEAALTLRGRLDNGLHLLGGSGFGITRGAGSAAFRVFVGVGYGRILLNQGDKDADGIPDDVDQCPKDRETPNGFQDTDGCPDEGGRLRLVTRVDGMVRTDVPIRIKRGDWTTTVDSWLEPVEIEIPNGVYEIKAVAAGKGAEMRVPIENTSELVFLDMKALVPGTLGIDVVDGNGNLIDRVGLSITGEDAPTEPIVLGRGGLVAEELLAGEYIVFLRSPEGASFRKRVFIGAGQHTQITAVLGQPRAVLKDDRIEVADVIYFDTGKATIQAESLDLIDEIALLIQDNPQLKLIEIRGHTDADGSEESNQTLSQSRAEAVLRQLVVGGVKERRLTAVGFGEKYPIASNSTDEGKAKNRRVEFVIVETE